MSEEGLVQLHQDTKARGIAETLNRVPFLAEDRGSMCIKWEGGDVSEFYPEAEPPEYEWSSEPFTITAEYSVSEGTCPFVLNAMPRNTPVIMPGDELWENGQLFAVIPTSFGSSNGGIQAVMTASRPVLEGEIIMVSLRQKNRSQDQRKIDQALRPSTRGPSPLLVVRDPNQGSYNQVILTRPIASNFATGEVIGAGKSLVVLSLMNLDGNWTPFLVAGKQQGTIPTAEAIGEWTFSGPVVRSIADRWAVSDRDQASNGPIAGSLSDISGIVIVRPTTDRSWSLPNMPGGKVHIKNAGSAIATIEPNYQQTIENATSIVLNPRDCVQVFGDGSVIRILSKYTAGA